MIEFLANLAYCAYVLMLAVMIPQFRIFLLITALFVSAIMLTDKKS